jgi:PiT family inorganic phosphate transporter
MSSSTMTCLLFLATCFVAYSNGANDNFKGVASLFGSRTTGYRTAIGWATVTTGAGSVAAIFLAQGLLKRFSGKGLVPDQLTVQPEFILAVALAAGATVILATLLGFPISTTHSLTGALVGAGLLTGVGNVNFAALGKNFLMPLLVSPVIAVVTGAVLYGAARAARLALGVGKEFCVCVGTETQVIPIPRPNGLFAAEALPQLTVTADDRAVCQQKYTGRFLGVSMAHAVDLLHFASAGAVSFARGLNDTPKIAALLLIITALDTRWSLVTVAVAIAIGGLLNARKVADTMAHKITAMNPGQGLAANLATAILVNTASIHGLPVSTTHVSVGALLGIGITTGQAQWKPVLNVVLSWIVTLPCAAALSATTYLVLRLF